MNMVFYEYNVTKGRPMMSWIFVDIVSGNGLPPFGAKRLPRFFKTLIGMTGQDNKFTKKNKNITKHTYTKNTVRKRNTYGTYIVMVRLFHYA